MRGVSGQEAMPVNEIDEGVSWTLAERRAATLSDLRYRYHLRIPRDRDRRLEGTVEIRFVWSDPETRDLVLDFKDPADRVTAVRANGAAAGWVARHDHVMVPAAALRPDQENRVELDFEAGDEALNRNDDFLYTLFVPDRAHFSLPLFDQPNLKARFELTLEVPDDWVAVANGGAVGGPAPAGPEGWVTWRFAETQPIPTYLFAFAAGSFQIETAERSGRRLRMFHRETDAAKVARNREAIFDLHAAALDWLEDYTGIPYPFGKFDFALIPPFQYGGMEHPGSIFYRASSLMLDESATQAAYLGRASLIAHETAHMWFGDLVTMNWFDDVWTKEVFANFLAAKIVHPSFPEVDHDLRFFLAHHQAAYAVDRTAGANPIRQPLENLKEAGALYGPIIYQKAPVVMRHLERLVGDARFRDGLREYLQAFEYGNATWPELIDILDRRTETDLRSWSAAWVEEPGRPTVTVRRESGDGASGGGRLTLVQSDPAGRARLWPQRIELLLAYDDAEVRIPLLLAGPTASVDLDRPAPRFVLPNATGVEYGRFRLDAASTGFLMTALPDIADPLTRGIAWGTLWEAVIEGEIPVGDWFELLLRGLAAESVEQNAQRLLGYLSTTCWSLRSDAARRAAAPRVEAILWAGVENSAETTRRAAYFRAWHGLVRTPDGGGAAAAHLGGGGNRAGGDALGTGLHRPRRRVGGSRRARHRGDPGAAGRPHREPGSAGPFRLPAARAVGGSGGAGALLRPVGRGRQPRTRAVGAGRAGLSPPSPPGRACPAVHPPRPRSARGDPAHRRHLLSGGLARRDPRRAQLRLRRRRRPPVPRPARVRLSAPPAGEDPAVVRSAVPSRAHRRTGYRTRRLTGPGA